MSAESHDTRAMISFRAMLEIVVFLVLAGVGFYAANVVIGWFL